VSGSGAIQLCHNSNNCIIIACTESLLDKGSRKFLNLSISYNLFLLYGYGPDAFHQATIIPLAKCKAGDFSDVNS